MASALREPIAIVGIGCRFPGADGPRAYWQLLCDGVDAITEIPPSRFDLRRYYDPAPATPGRVTSRWGGFLHDIEKFDAEFFGVSPREAERLDPQQRWLLEVAWDALEDAGAVPSRLAGSNTGVFVGMWINEYENRLFRDPRALDFYMTIGSGRYAASGRLSYVFGLQGPSITIDSGCSASLAAVHLACQSLWNGESTTALAAGVNAILEPNITIAYSQSRMMAPDGRCKFGDARADGYVRSEGAGMVVLKRLSDAVANGDRIYATILGSSLNNDGRSSGFLTTPGSGGQQEMLRQAYRNAGVAPASVSYVEAHGTGTRAGDPVELEALGLVLGEGRAPDAPCRVGSVKTNIGHTEGAAGLAGLIKVALSLHHRFLPRSLHFNEPNPDIPWASLPLRMQTEGEAWPASVTPPVAGVSSFGIAGTNAHVVLQGMSTVPSDAASTESSRPVILALSAASDAALDARLRQFGALLSDPAVSLQDVCWTANVRRDALDCRVAMTARTREELISQVESARAGESHDGLARGRRPHGRAGNVVFVFPGQGSQWLGMGRQLLEREPAFRDALLACDDAITQESGWSVVGQVLADPSSSRLSEIDVVQPVLFSIEVALAALWRSWGFVPAAVVGHSMGEVAAAHVAGALSLAQAAQIICRRSRLLLRASGQGAMALVDLTMAEAQAAVQPLQDRLSVAVSNSTRSTVISGDPAALDELLALLQARDVFCRRVKVDVASHSPQMDPLRADLLAALQGLSPRAGSTPMCSTVSGDWCEGASLDAGYWVRNLRAPVLFSAAVARLLETGHDTFIEMSPHPILVPAVLENISEHNVPGAIAVGSTRRDEDEQLALMASAAALFASGHPVCFDGLSPEGRLAELPSYPWQRERHWFEAPAQLDLVTGSGTKPAPASLHAVLPEPIASAHRAGSFAWHFELEASAVRRACVETHVEVPAAFHLELLIACARAVCCAGPLSANDVRLLTPQAIPADDTTVRMQIAMDLVAPATYSWRLFSNVSGDWVEHAQASIVAGENGAPVAPPLAGSVIPVAIAPDREHELQLYRAHPALIGSALQAAAGRIGAAGRRMNGARRVWVRGLLTREMAVQCADGDADALVMLDAAGVAVLGIEGIAFAADGEQSRASGSVADWTYALQWEPAPMLPAPAASSGDRNWILVGHREAANAIAGALRTMREHVTVAMDVDGLHDALDISRRGSMEVIHIAGAAAGSLPDRAEGEIKSALRTAEKMIAREGDGRARRLWFLTVGAQQVHDREPVDCSQAPLWGLARTVAEEHPSLWGGAIDLQPATPPAAVALALIAAVTGGDGEDQVAFRGGDRYALRLTRSVVPRHALAVRPNCTYLIAGGLGNLGLEVARWLTNRGARRIVLIGRQGLPTSADSSLSSQQRTRLAAVRALRDSGALVHIAAVDIADRAAVDALLAELSTQGWPTLGAVFQCAGVTEGNLLGEIRDDAFDRVWRAKVPGTCALLDATANTPLDAFVMFSSMASFLPSPGQASYAAANAFLDGVAADRRAGDRPAISINWGPWADIGMAAELNRRGALGVGGRGFQGLAIDQAIGALEKVAGEQLRPQLAVMAFDWRKWRGGVPVPLMSHLAATEPIAVLEQGPVDLRARLSAAADDAQRRTVLEGFLQGQLASVLKRPTSRVELTAPVRSMGLDSLMALELRNRLEALIGLRLPATLAWNHPTVVAMAAFIGEKLQAFTDVEAPLAAAPADDLEQLLAEIEQMPDDEARRLALEGHEP